MAMNFLLAHTTSLTYAYRAGGPRLLDVYRTMAQAGGRELAISRTVAFEIEAGPLRRELGEYLVDRKVPILEAPETQRLLRTGAISHEGASNDSLIEIANRELEEGRSPIVWSDYEHA
ncbi:hypothetical protein [Pseudomonas sp. CGJS7]|uniref:hypothetical protein n=1 Tax=Pseudomonas sp. CGJS7 TaxID=3109348 RepID=UPI00300A59C8